ncbi:MAG: PEP-CTERM sorting domain-containing protein [Opitutaceae bacterium]
MSKTHIIGLVGVFAATAASAQLATGFDQRYVADDYTIGTATWTADTGVDATTTAAADFVATLTPNGSAAVSNTNVGGDNSVFSFTRGSELGSAGQLTVQSVIRIDTSGDNRSGPYALNQTSGWGGLYAGANVDGSNDSRGGNIGNTGTNTTVINGASGSAVTAGTWGVYTVTVDSTVASPQMTVTFTDLLTGIDLFTDTINNGTIGAGTLGLSNDGVLFGGEQGGGADATNGWGGAIADVVVYNSLLSGAAITSNISEFQDLYQVPEPSSYALLAGMFGLAAVMVRRRKA